MKLRADNQLVVLQGDPFLHKTRISLKHMVKLLQHEKQGVWVEFGCLSVAQLEAECPAAFTHLLRQFEGVFHTPTSLPPARNHDHAITLQPGTSPVSVRPYRYPYHIKAEVERLVQEMLIFNPTPTLFLVSFY